MVNDFVIFALASAFLWGVSPIFSKRGLARGGTYIEASIVSVGTSGFIFLILSLLMIEDPISTWSNPRVVIIFVFGGVFGSAFGRLAVFEGENRVGASITSCALGTTPVVAAVLGYFGLGEVVSAQAILGIVVLVFGVGCLSLSRGGNIDGWHPALIVIPMLGAFFFGTGNVIRRYGLVEFPTELLPVLTINEFSALGFIAGYAYYKRHDSPFELRFKNGVYFTIAAVLTTLAMLSMFTALGRGPVAMVETILSTGPLFTTFFTYLFLNDLERITPGVMVGALLIVVGAMLVSVSP